MIRNKKILIKEERGLRMINRFRMRTEYWVAFNSFNKNEFEDSDCLVYLLAIRFAF